VLDDPSAVPTQLARVPLRRLGLSEEVADSIVFIASDEARWITVDIQNVAGGMTAN
jgi:NAD(P)-dependent dehydrogenase (short-subunit alcohol dehydrogenase family)